jgi:hypothetical protein
MPLAEWLIPEFDQEMAVTRRVLERYLRLNSSPIPAVYGPTADEPRF